MMFVLPMIFKKMLASHVGCCNTKCDSSSDQLPSSLNTLTVQTVRHVYLNTVLINTSMFGLMFELLTNEVVLVRKYLNTKLSLC